MVDHNKQNNKNYERYEHGVQRQRSRASDQVVPFAVLGLSLGALALSVYAITGGPVDNYLANRQQMVAYANESVADDPNTLEQSSDIEEIVGQGEYDITVQIDEDGERQYVLTPIKSDETDGDTPDSDDDGTVDSGADDDLGNESEDEEPVEDDDDSSETELSEEAQEKLDEHKSMRLRIEPDRDGQDIYYYVVESGDTLAMISEEFNVPMGQLMEENHIDDGNLIFVGEVIFMPTDFVK